MYFRGLPQPCILGPPGFEELYSYGILMLPLNNKPTRRVQQNRVMNIHFASPQPGQKVVKRMLVHLAEKECWGANARRSCPTYFVPRSPVK